MDAQGGFRISKELSSLVGTPQLSFYNNNNNNVSRDWITIDEWSNWVGRLQILEGITKVGTWEQLYIFKISKKGTVVGRQQQDVFHFLWKGGKWKVSQRTRPLKNDLSGILRSLLCGHLVDIAYYPRQHQDTGTTVDKVRVVVLTWYDDTVAHAPKQRHSWSFSPPSVPSRLPSLMVAMIPHFPHGGTIADAARLNTP